MDSIKSQRIGHNLVTFTGGQTWEFGEFFFFFLLQFSRQKLNLKLPDLVLYEYEVTLVKFSAFLLCLQ